MSARSDIDSNPLVAYTASSTIRPAMIALLQTAGNDECADCHRRMKYASKTKPEPVFISLTLGVFICQRCAHFHTKAQGRHR